MPDWVMTLEVAKEWGVPPWVIEEDASWTWMERWRVMREEKALWKKQESTKQKKRSVMNDGGQ